MVDALPLPLLLIVIAFNLLWAFMSLRRDGFRREFNARRRGSNPPPPGRKPAPPAGPTKPEPHGGQLFVNNKPQFPPPREIIEDFWPRSSNQTPNPPPRHP
jgi:hypothetical protein